MALRIRTTRNQAEFADRARRHRSLLRRWLDDRGRRGVRAPASRRPHARGVRRRCDRRRSRCVPVRAHRSRRAGALRGRDRRRRPARRTGAAGILDRMMRAQLADIRERGEPLAALWASEETIYGRFGYGLAAQDAMIRATRVHAALRPELPGPDRDDAARRPRRGAAKVFPRIYDRVRRQSPGLRLPDAGLVGAPEARRPSRAPARSGRAQPRRCSSSTAGRRGTRSTASSSSSTSRTTRAQVRVIEAHRRLAGGDAGALALPARDRLGGRDPLRAPARRPSAVPARRSGRTA